MAGRKRQYSEAESYDRQAARGAARDASSSLAARDIGPIPPIVNLDRRKACRDSLRLFCETYNPSAFSLGWSADHLRVIQRIEEAAKQGALYAYAMPRGSGKTTIARMAALWAVVNGFRRYVVVIGATATKAEESLDAIKTYARFLQDFAEDYPEICYPIVRMAGIHRRAAGQLSRGESTLLDLQKDRIIFPTVLPPENWPAEWALRSDGRVPTSGAALTGIGLTGDGIRGSVLTLSTGESIRPDFVLLDDPQTNESAYSLTQNTTRERLVSADVLGMAGPGKSISAVMPCTVIAKGDFVDRITDRKLHPLWRGERTKLVSTMPKNMEAWDRYFEVYRSCALKEPPDYSEANEYYQSRRTILEEGAVVAWEGRKLDWEVSALQGAMHLYYLSPLAFASEYQNEPSAIETGQIELTVDDLGNQVNGLKRGVVPQWATRLTIGVDIQGQILFWLVAAWRDDYTGAIVDYSTVPKQTKSYFVLREASPNLTALTGSQAEETRIHKGLTILAEEVLNRAWLREDGHQVHVERVLVDASYQTDLIRQWVRGCGRAGLVPSLGRYFGVSAKPMAEWKSKPGERRGPNWILSKHLIFDSNYWKSQLYTRLAVPYPGHGSLSLFGDKKTNHRMLFDHLTAEQRIRVQGGGRTVDEWKLKPNHENHWFDCLVMATVAASVLGCAVPEVKAAYPSEKTRKRVSYSEMQAKARQGVR